MNATETATGATAGPSMPETRQVPLSRLTRVELRKLTDTRSGMWLLITIAAITALVVVIVLFVAEPSEMTYENFVNATGTPQGFLLPVLGILTVTSEWGQRTGLVTFTLEPHRSRVVIAKLAAAVLMALAAVAVAFALAAVFNLLGMALFDGSGSWNLGLDGTRDILVLQLTGIIQGVAFGMLIMNGAGAIVAFFAIPTVWGILASLIGWVADLADWVDLGTTSAPLQTHTMDGKAWAQLAVASAIWILLPLVLGWLRLLRRELKSA